MNIIKFVLKLLTAALALMIVIPVVIAMHIIATITGVNDHYL